MRAAVVSLLALAVALTLRGADPPPAAAEVTPAGTIRVALHKSLLQRAEVRKHLMSGLTANFVVSIAKREQLGRIEIRYEPWDEVFYALAVSFDGKTEPATLRSMAELERWWSTPRLIIGSDPGTAPIVRLVFEVVPFSASEEADAKKWIARSLAERAPATQTGGVATPQVPSLFSAVVGSSIRRKPVLRYSWDVRLERNSR
jgi:hypothetical protein